VAGAPAHHRERGYANLNPSHVTAGAWTRFTFFVSRIWASTFTPRTANFPQVASDLWTIHDDRGAVTVTWVGHATLLIQLDGVNILTDPHWSARASPVSFAGPRRVSAPGLKFEDLPPIHAVVISHDHYVTWTRRRSDGSPRSTGPGSSSRSASNSGSQTSASPMSTSSTGGANANCVG
jgi:hypothetical protein